jgi:hypothetical protein
MRSAPRERERHLALMRRINAHVANITGERVATGPFAGMWVPFDAPWDDGNVGTKFAGSYEHELHRIVEVALRREPSTIVNVGCAEGFYAVGFALRAPRAQVVAFDIDPASLRACREATRKNGVAERVTILRGVQDPRQMAVGGERRLIVVDCEGNEGFLLDPRLCPSLARSDLIVECHDYLKPGVSGIIAERFERTHIVGLIEPRPPAVASYPFLASLPFGVLMEAITEKRPPGTVWLVAWAK